MNLKDKIQENLKEAVKSREECLDEINKKQQELKDRMNNL